MCQIISVDVIILRRQLAKVTFDVFTCNRMVQLQKGVSLTVTDLETWGLGLYTLAFNSDNYSMLR